MLDTFAQRRCLRYAALMPAYDAAAPLRHAISSVGADTDFFIASLLHFLSVIPNNNKQ